MDFTCFCKLIRLAADVSKQKAAAWNFQLKTVLKFALLHSVVLSSFLYCFTSGVQHFLFGTALFWRGSEISICGAFGYSFLSSVQEIIPVSLQCSRNPTSDGSIYCDSNVSVIWELVLIHSFAILSSIQFSRFYPPYATKNVILLLSILHRTALPCLARSTKRLQALNYLRVRQAQSFNKHSV